VGAGHGPGPPECGWKLRPQHLDQESQGRPALTGLRCLVQLVSQSTPRARQPRGAAERWWSFVSAIVPAILALTSASQRRNRLSCCQYAPVSAGARPIES